MRSFFVVVCLLAAAGTAAQPDVRVLPGRLFYQGETTFTVENASGAAVTLDSAAVRFGYPRLRAYLLQTSGPGVTTSTHYVNPYGRQSFAVGAVLAAGASATLEIVDFDPCIVCRPAAAAAAFASSADFRAGPGWARLG